MFEAEDSTKRQPESRLTEIRHDEHELLRAEEQTACARAALLLCDNASLFLEILKAQDALCLVLSYVPVSGSQFTTSSLSIMTLELFRISVFCLLPFPDIVTISCLLFMTNFCVGFKGPLKCHYFPKVYCGPVAMWISKLTSCCASGHFPFFISSGSCLSSTTRLQNS